MLKQINTMLHGKMLFKEYLTITVVTVETLKQTQLITKQNYKLKLSLIQMLIQLLRLLTWIIII